MKNSKKLVNLISLVVLVTTNILSPLSYVMAEEDLDIGDTASYWAEQDSWWESYDDSDESTDDDSEMAADSQLDDQDDEWDIDNSSEPHPTPLQTPSKSSPDRDDLWDFQSPGEGSPDEIETGEVDNETPMDSSLRSEWQDNTQEWQTNTQEADDKTEENSAIDILKSLFEDSQLSLSVIESEEIYWTWEYEWVKVEVYAQTWAFPLWTILNIIPITWDDEMRDIQDVLEAQKNVEKSQKVIAFDITFLDPETEEELQPSITGAVQVTFNYEENEELLTAEQDEEQEVKVYHLNDKDEEWEKIENITWTIVEDILINKEASEEVENWLVIDAESFSYYTIVVQIREEAPESDPTQTWQYGEDYFTISIAKPVWVDDEWPAWFTIMDRNLWASTGNINSTDSYWNYYQWWNNYGFNYSLQNNVTVITEWLTWDESYKNNGYVSKKWINGSSHDYDVWDGKHPTSNDKEHHDWIWWWENDAGWNNRWANQSNPAERQWPCPEWWHVPSAWEWWLLVKYYAYASWYSSSIGWSQWLYYLSNNEAREWFMNYFKLPFAGYRSYSDASLSNQGSYGYYWSSSPYSADSYSARYLYLNSSYVLANYIYGRANGLSVRCFKDSYVASPESSNLVDTQAWVEGEDFETITISNPDNINEWFTIMDRNLWAENAVVSTTASTVANTGSYGFHYQWWNNYWFEQWCWTNGCSNPNTSSAITTLATWNENGIYNNHGYFGNKFIKGSSDYWQSSAHYDNLRWWAGDVEYANNVFTVCLPYK